MANSADPDQLASSEANLIWIYTVFKGSVYLGSAGKGLKHMLWNLISKSAKPQNICFHIEKIRNVSILVLLIAVDRAFCFQPNITKTRLFKYSENFTTKKWQFFR